MPSAQPRVVVVVACITVLTATGCLGGPGIASDDARERALTAEEWHLHDRLSNASCVDGWGADSYAGVQVEATVINRTEAGVYVDVVHPFWYGTSEVDADAVSEATYLVTTNTTRRVSGTDVSPC